MSGATLGRDTLGCLADSQAVGGDGLPAAGHAQRFVVFGSVGMVLGRERTNATFTGAPAVAVTRPASTALIVRRPSICTGATGSLESGFQPRSRR